MYVWRTIFLNHDIRVSSKWAKNIKSSSELQLFNPQIPIWNILLEISTLRKKSTISSTGRDTYTPSRAKSVVKKDNLELSGKKKKKRIKKQLSFITALPSRKFSFVWIYQQFPFINSAVQKKPNSSSGFWHLLCFWLCSTRMCLHSSLSWKFLNEKIGTETSSR